MHITIQIFQCLLATIRIHVHIVELLPHLIKLYIKIKAPASLNFIVSKGLETSIFVGMALQYNIIVPSGHKYSNECIFSVTV